MRSFAGFLMIGLVLCSCTVRDPERADPPPLDPSIKAELAEWLDTHGLPPAQYVTGLFSEHDVVFLGEQHRVKHDVELVGSLPAPLNESGVRVLATEFARREDQWLIDSLLVAPEWDERLAREIVFRGFVWWASSPSRGTRSRA